MRKLAPAVLGLAALGCVSPFAAPPPDPPPLRQSVRHARPDDSWQADNWGFQGRVAVGPTDVAERPEILTHVNPSYPDEARRQKISGLVILEVRIDAEGRVTAVVVLQSLTSELDQAAFDAVRQWTYKPARLNGASLPSVTAVTVDFQVQ